MHKHRALHEWDTFSLWRQRHVPSSTQWPGSWAPSSGFHRTTWVGNVQFIGFALACLGNSLKTAVSPPQSEHRWCPLDWLIGRLCDSFAFMDASASFPFFFSAMSHFSSHKMAWDNCPRWALRNASYSSDVMPHTNTQHPDRDVVDGVTSQSLS
jgi:hypothetical protein